MDIIKIRGTNLEVTDEIKDYLYDRLEDVDRFLANTAGTKEAEVELERTTEHHESGNIFRAEIMIDLKGEVLRAESEKEDIHTAIDDIKEEISRLVKKYKEKKQTKDRDKSRWFKKILRLSPLARGDESEEEEIIEEEEEEE